MERAGDLKLNSSCLEVKDPGFVFKFFFLFCSSQSFTQALPFHDVLFFSLFYSWLPSYCILIKAIIALTATAIRVKLHNSPHLCLNPIRPPPFTRTWQSRANVHVQSILVYMVAHTHSSTRSAYRYESLKHINVSSSFHQQTVMCISQRCSM